MGKSFGFQPHSGNVFNVDKRLPSFLSFFLILSDCRYENLIKRAYSQQEDYENVIITDLSNTNSTVNVSENLIKRLTSLCGFPRNTEVKEP